MKELMIKIKNKELDENLLEELNDSGLIIKSECFGDNSDTAMCVRVVEIDGDTYYIADGFEWVDASNDPFEVVEWGRIDGLSEVQVEELKEFLGI